MQSRLICWSLTPSRCSRIPSTYTCCLWPSSNSHIYGSINVSSLRARRWGGSAWLVCTWLEAPMPECSSAHSFNVPRLEEPGIRSYLAIVCQKKDSHMLLGRSTWSATFMFSSYQFRVFGAWTWSCIVSWEYCPYLAWERCKRLRYPTKDMTMLTFTDAASALQVSFDLSWHIQYTAQMTGHEIFSRYPFTRKFIFKESFSEPP